MTSPSIPDKAVEAAAEVLWHGGASTPWKAVDPSIQEYWRLRAEQALTAALPHLTEGAEPVAWVDDAELERLKSGRMATAFGTKAEGSRENPLYAHPASPKLKGEA